MHILVASIEHQKYGFLLEAIERVFLAVEVIPLPNVPDHILGIINSHGEIIPVINLRLLLGLSTKSLALNDRFILCQVDQQKLVLWVDEIKYVREFKEEELSYRQESLAKYPHIEAIVKEGEELILICNLMEMIPKTFSTGAFLHA